MIRRSASIALQSLATLLACAGGERFSDASVRVDTVNGVEHVVARDAPPAWRLERQRSIGRLGGAGSQPTPDEFGRIRWLAIDASGSVYVADAAASEIRVFDTVGVHARSFGRPGAGPGEFGRLQAITFLGDTLVVMDPNNGRLALLDRTGTQLDQWPYPPISGNSDWFHDLGDGSVAMITLLRDEERLRRAYVVLTSRGATDTIVPPQAADRGIERGMECDGTNGAIHFYTTPLAPRHIASPAPGGGVVAAWSDAYRIAFLGEAGDTLRVIERHGESYAIPDTMRRRVDAEYDEFRATPGMRACKPASLPTYDVLPPINHLMFDGEGRLWVEILDEHGRRWDIFSPDGIPLGSARGGARLDAVRPALRGDWLAVVEEAPEGHHRVVVYRLIEDT
jgi:hypothetical protein